MKKNIITLLVLALSTVAVAQDKAGVGFGTKKISKAAMLDIQAKNKGVLLPRIELTNETHALNGNNNPEGVIVYNIGEALEHGFYYWTGAKWEKVAANSQIVEQITNLETKVTEEIKNITNIIGEPSEGGQTDISYLVSYNPQTAVFTYLLPKEGGGYDKQVIDLKAEAQKAETNTFVRPFTETVGEGEEAKQVVSAYIYFSEDAIKTWLEANPNGDPVANMPDGDGTKMDVLGVVNNNFKEIFKNNTNTEIINEIIKESPDNVWVDVTEDGKTYLVYNDKDNVKQIVPLDQNETQTSMFKHTVTTAGVAAPETPTEVLDTEALEEGAIYYSYKGEHGKTFYINMTNDVINSIQNNKTLKEEIFNTVNNYSTDGGNVYFGKLDGGTDDVLYIVKEGKAEAIDISKDIEKVLQETTNNVIVEKILEQTEVKVLIDKHDVVVGTSIDTAKVYKGKRTIKVDNQEDGYDVTFNGTIKVNPTKKVIAENGKDVSYESTGENMETLLSATIINVLTKQIVTTNVTDVEVNNNELTFYFGNASMYTALDNGTYQVVFEYTAK